MKKRYDNQLYHRFLRIEKLITYHHLGHTLDLFEFKQDNVSPASRNSQFPTLGAKEDELYR